MMFWKRESGCAPMGDGGVHDEASLEAELEAKAAEAAALRAELQAARDRHAEELAALAKLTTPLPRAVAVDQSLRPAQAPQGLGRGVEAVDSRGSGRIDRINLIESEDRVPVLAARVSFDGAPPDDGHAEGAEEAAASERAEVVVETRLDDLLTEDGAIEHGAAILDRKHCRVALATWRGRRVVCKQSRESRLGEGYRELALLATLRHPNIVRLLAASLETPTEPKLVLFYDFDDRSSAHIPNLGTAGSDYDLV